MSKHSNKKKRGEVIQFACNEKEMSPWFLSWRLRREIVSLWDAIQDDLNNEGENRDDYM